MSASIELMQECLVGMGLPKGVIDGNLLWTNIIVTRPNRQKIGVRLKVVYHKETENFTVDPARFCEYFDADVLPHPNPLNKREYNKHFSYYEDVVKDVHNALKYLDPLISKISLEEVKILVGLQRKTRDGLQETAKEEEMKVEIELG